VTHDGTLGAAGGRILRAWGRLPGEERLAAGAAAGLLLAMFLPWYQDTVVTAKLAIPVSVTISGWGAFSFFEAMVVIVAIGTLVLLFQRGEGRTFVVPGGDGGALLAGGAFASLLVVVRMFDKNSLSVSGPGITTAGIDWGIFVALAMAVLLAYCGLRLRATDRATSEPPLDVPDPAVLRAERREASSSERAAAGAGQLRMPVDVETSHQPGDEFTGR
jgi:hypothetical protein